MVVDLVGRFPDDAVLRFIPVVPERLLDSTERCRLVARPIHVGRLIDVKAPNVAGSVDGTLAVIDPERTVA